MALISATAKHTPPVYRLQWRATGEDFHKMLDNVKAIPGRRFDMESKTWSVPDLPTTALRLHELGFAIEGLAGAPSVEPAQALAPVVHAYANEWENIPIDRGLFPNLFPKQIGDLQFFTWAGGKALLVGEVGYGKRLAFGTPVLTLEGYKPIETLDPGVDKVLGIDGKPYSVLEKWVNLDRPLFRLKFSDGTEIEADDEHLWTVYVRGYLAGTSECAWDLTTSQLFNGPYTTQVNSNSRYFHGTRYVVPSIAEWHAFPLGESREIVLSRACKWGANFAPSIESITRIPNGPGACISVDSPDHLYLTKNCIPTHNTVSGLSWLKLRPDLRPALIVTRANIKTQWQKQWKNWVNDGSIPEILSGETPYSLRPDRSYIINREILHKWEGAISAIAPRCVIGDECQDFGNDKAQKTVKGVDEEGNEVSKSVSIPVLRTQAFVNLCKQAPSLILLSATPFNSRVQQFFTVLNLLDPQQFPNKWAYQMRYCDAKPGAFGGWDFTGASNLQELHAKTARLMLFRDRDRTNATRHQTLILDTEMSDKERAKELAAISAWDVGGNLEGALLALEELGASHFKYKRKAVFQWLKGSVDNGEKVVVFARHRAVVEAIAGSLGKKGALYYGGMTDRARSQALEAFTKGGAQVLVANMEAAGVGLDGLQHVCHRVAFAEIPTSASTAKQCIGRVDRTGQTKDVDALFLCGEGTADELALQVLKERWGVLDCIRHGTAISDTQAVMEATKKWRAKK